MKNTGTLKVTTPNDRGILLTRVFDAPRSLVFDALTQPELLKRWFGPHGWTLIHSEVDLKVGGKWRSILRGPDGREMGMSGVYQQIMRPEGLVSTEAFDDYPGESLNTLRLSEENGKTTLTCTMLYPTKEVRDLVIQTGMEHGAAETYDRLAELLPTTMAREKSQSVA